MTTDNFTQESKSIKKSLLKILIFYVFKVLLYGKHPYLYEKNNNDNGLFGNKESNEKISSKLNKINHY